MADKKPVDFLNLEDKKYQVKHKREFRWKILFPFILGTAVILSVPLAMGMLGIGTISTWSEISTIFLSVPLMFCSVLIIALMIGGIYLISILLNRIPSFLMRTRKVVGAINHNVSNFSNSVTEPYIKLSSLKASVSTILKIFKIIRKQTKQKDQI